MSASEAQNVNARRLPFHDRHRICVSSTRATDDEAQSAKQGTPGASRAGASVTKAKHRAFHGAWLDGRIPRRELLAILANEPRTKINADAILGAVSRQREIWRFDLTRRSLDPQPAQWVDLVRAIEIPEQPTLAQILQIQREIGALPAMLIGGLNHHLFFVCGVSKLRLFERLQTAIEEADVKALRTAFALLAADVSSVVGKRGPKADFGPPLRAVANALIAYSSPPMKPASARALAAVLLRECGIRVPESRSQLAKLAAKR